MCKQKFYQHSLDVNGSIYHSVVHSGRFMGGGRGRGAIAPPPLQCALHLKIDGKNTNFRLEIY